MGRSCRVSKQGLEKAEVAFKLKGWTQEYLAGATGCSRPTVNRFFARRPVEMRLFQTICTELSLEWGEIADLESESEPLSRYDKDKIIQEPSGTTQVLTDKKSHAFAIAGTVSPEDIAKLKAIIALIQKVSQDSSITIVDIERGSIKLILEGSQEGLERLENLFRSGQLEDLLDVSVEDVEFITLNNSTSEKKRLAFTIAGDVAESEIAKLKTALIKTSDNEGRTELDSQSRHPAHNHASPQYESQRTVSRINPINLNLVFANLIRGNLYGAFRLLKNLLRANLSGANLSRAILIGANLSGANLSGANLSRADLSRAILSRADLSRANLSRANLSRANLSDANLSRAILIGVKIDEATQLDSKWRLVWDIVNHQVVGRDLSNADLRNADLILANLRNANLRNANLRNANLSNANLSGADLIFAILIGADLRNADLSSADLRNADLRNADLSRANLRGANLSGVNLNEETQIDGKWRLVWDIVNHQVVGRDLSNADLRNANLSGANLSGVNLKNANLSNANLSNANLSDANLSDAILSSANLILANLRDAIVMNAFFGESKGLTENMKRDLKKRGAIFDNRPQVLNSK